MLILQFFIYLFLIIIPIGAIIIFYRVYWSRKKQEWMSSRKFVLLQILVPKDNEKTPLAAEQMFASIHGIFRTDERFQEQVSFEIAARDKYIYLYVRVPEDLKDFVEGQIYAQYPAVEIFETPDYSQEYNQELKIASSEILLNKEDVYPIKSFKNFEVDPLSAITGVLTKIEKDEQVWIQLIIRPVSDDWQMKGVSHVSAIRAGRPTSGGAILLAFKIILNFFAEMFRIAAGGGTSAESSSAQSEVKLSAPKEAALKGIEEKITKLGFAAKIRVVALSDDEYAARSKINAVAGAFKQFNTTNLNSFVQGKITNDTKSVRLYQEREFENKGFVLNIEEVASLFHLPTLAVETPNFVWAGSKKGEPPSNLPIIGSAPEEDLTVFAQTNFRHIKHKFGIKKKDRRLHFYAIGKTGTGKSVMLENMILDDIRKGRGVAVVDPHGELINHVLHFIPSNRINDVVYFDPSDREFPIGFNPLENVDPDLKNIVASGVVGIFKKIFGESWGPRLEYILRNTILALLDYPDSTLLGIMKLLIDKDYRKKVVSKVKDPVIRDFFINEFEKYEPKFRTEAIAPIQNKVGQFLSSSTIRNIVGQPKSSFNIREVMDEGKILLIDLSIGKIGEDNAALLGAMMITKIQLAAMQRANISEEKRRDFYLYVDEFQNFATDSFAIILSEARKYHLNLILTNQYIAQMLPTVANAIFGNVGTLVSFRVGSADASALLKEFEPVFTAHDLVNLDNYNIYVKMAVDGVTRPAFSAVTLPPNKVIGTNNLQKIINASREHYGKSRVFVEEKIIEWSGGLSPTSFGIENKESREAVEADGSYKQVVDIKGKKWYLPPKQDKSKTLISADEIDKLNREKENNRPKEHHKMPSLTQLKAGESIKIDSSK